MTTDASGVVSVDKSGKITALKEGTALVTATVGEATASLRVNVGSLVPTKIEITGSLLYIPIWKQAFTL